MGLGNPMKGAMAKATKAGAAVGMEKFSVGGLGMAFGANFLFNTEKDFGAKLGVAARDTFLWEMVGGKVMWPYMAMTSIIPGAITGADAMGRQLRSQYSKSHRAAPTFSYKDTEQALTMRQAAVQAIQGSKMNARNALGGEATLMHRGWGGRT